jgi:hypothetical protein
MLLNLTKSYQSQKKPIRQNHSTGHHKNQKPRTIGAGQRAVKNAGSLFSLYATHSRGFGQG